MARRELSAELGRDRGVAVLAGADAAYPELSERAPRSRFGARDLLRTSAYSAGLYQALVQEGLGAERARTLVSDVVFVSIMPARTLFYRVAGLWRRDPMERARWGSDVSRRLYYTSPDWLMYDVAVDEGFGFDVTRCVVAEFFESLGMSELCQRAICDQDIRSAAAHGIVLERSQTLSAGGDRCDFRYRRGEMPSRPKQRARGGVLSPRSLVDTVLVDAPPEAVWSWLAGIADHYLEWHPDHVSAEWIRGTPNRAGSRLRAVEDIAGRREELVFEMTDVEAPRRMEYRILGPHSIVLPGGGFEISRCDQGTLFRATIRYRFGRLAEVVFGRRIAALRTHMREEGENLKALVEAAPGSR